MAQCGNVRQIIKKKMKKAVAHILLMQNKFSKLVMLFVIVWVSSEYRY